MKFQDLRQNDDLKKIMGSDFEQLTKLNSSYVVEEFTTTEGYQAQIKLVLNNILGWPVRGQFNGYLKPKNKYHDVQLETLSVHGGITYNQDGWIGFDTAHADDYIDWSEPKKDYQQYRSVEYVKQELIELSKQIEKLDNMDTLYYVVTSEIDDTKFLLIDAVQLAKYYGDIAPAYTGCYAGCLHYVNEHNIK